MALINSDSFVINIGEGPFIVTAIHDGHAISPDLMEVMNLNDSERLREEDPFTGSWVDITNTWIKVKDSRFEVDLNRPRDKAVYLRPEDAWGLQVWKTDLTKQQLENALKKYDHFYGEVKKMLDVKIKNYGGVLIFDLHTYNHRRDGKDQPPANPSENPEINIGTGNMNRVKWAPVVDGFIKQLSSFNYQSRNLDVRENIKFKGGHFSSWIHEHYPDKSCVLSIEVKKFFMDEWTGEADDQQLQAVKDALRSVIPSVTKKFQEIISSK